MSADACFFYYGLRFEIASQEIEALERRTDLRIVAARKAGLKSFWANCSAPDERYLLFIGAELGMLGREGKTEVQLAQLDLREIIESTIVKLRSAGLHGQPGFYMQWYADA